MRHNPQNPAAGSPRPPVSRQSLRGLDWLNFFVADVQTAFGPFVVVYLAYQGWQPTHIGLVLALGGIISIASQAPGGALIDAVSSERLLVGIAIGLIAAGALLFALWPSFWPIIVAVALQGSTGGVVRAALSALGLGLVGHRALSGRLGRNQSFKSFGNATTAAMMGAISLLSVRAPFYAAALLCIPAVVSLLTIRGEDIDYGRVRSAADRSRPRNSLRLRDAAQNHHLHAFVACLVLFQFANASLIPLATGRLGAGHDNTAELVTAAAVVIPELIAALLAIWIGRRTDEMGRKPLLLLGLGVVGIRAMVFAIAPGQWILLALQPLDGITAAVIGVMMPLVIADLTRGTGHYNLAQGYAGTAMGIGASISTGISGYVVQYFGYATGFLCLAAVGLMGCAVLYWLVPETKP